MNQRTSTQRAGLFLLGLLSLGDLAGLALTDGSHPPYAVAALGAALGAASIYLVVRAWRDPAYPVGLLVGLRILSAITVLPAFVVSDVPAAAKAAATAILVLTAVGILLTSRVQTKVVAS